MSKTFTTFALTALLGALLMALSLFLSMKGYPIGAVGRARLLSLTGPGAFLPLASIYFLAACLMMLLPLRAASFVLLNCADAVYWTTVTLFAVTVGLAVALWAFGDRGAPYTLLNWRYLFVLAIAVAHLQLNALRVNVLVRTLFAIIFFVIALAALFWSFAL